MARVPRRDTGVVAMTVGALAAGRDDLTFLSAGRLVVCGRVGAGDGVWVASSNFKMVKKHCVCPTGQTFALPRIMLGGTKPGRLVGRGRTSAWDGV